MGCGASSNPYPYDTASLVNGNETMRQQQQQQQRNSLRTDMMMNKNGGGSGSEMDSGRNMENTVADRLLLQNGDTVSGNHTTTSMDGVGMDVTGGTTMIADIDRTNVLQLFNNLESTIQTMEETKCFEKYRIISDDIEQLSVQVQHLDDKASEFHNQILNTIESYNVSSDITLRDIIVDNLSRRELAPQDTFLIELLNDQKINEFKIDLLQKDINNFTTEMKELQILCDQLHELYQQRDDVLNQTFEGNYGSEKEIQLEKELDSLMEERHYIEIAKMRWINSDNLIIDALKCLDNGVERIRQFENVPESDLLYRYTCIKEARNSLVLAHYNLISLHNNLQNVQLPHCKIEDLEEMEQRISQIFNDLSITGINLLIESMETLRTKTVTQHKWVKEVLNKTIKNDLMNIRDKCRSKSHELRFERAMLIKMKQEEWQQQKQQRPRPDPQPGAAAAAAAAVMAAPGDLIKHDSPFDLRVDSGVDSELDDSIIADEQYTRILASGNNSITSPDFSNTTPLLPGEELGPIPSNKEIFGKIIQIRNKHIREMQEFEQNQRLNRARMNQGLKEKLSVRRTRRNRLEMHKRQLEALQEYPAGSSSTSPSTASTTIPVRRISTSPVPVTASKTTTGGS